MAMASRPPERTRQPRRYVSRHAVNRLRERAKAAAHLSDDDLARALDDAVHRALSSGVARAVKDEEGPGKLVDLSLGADGICIEDGEPVYALVKENERDDTPWAEAVVTVLNGGATRLRDAETGDRLELPFNPAMAEALSGVRLPDPPPEEEGPGEYVVLVSGEAVAHVHSRERAVEEMERALNAGEDARLFARVKVKKRIRVEL